MKVVIYSEYNPSCREGEGLKAYPNGIHGTLQEMLEKENHEVKVFTLDSIEEMTDEVIQTCDVMLWWGHWYHDQISEELANKIVHRVYCGMGFIALHSAHLSKPFKKLMGTPCTLKWREIAENERLWVVNLTHPIAQGINEYVDIPHEEMYGEHFAIPTPDELVFIGWFKGGEVFRSGCCYQRGYGKVFYFQPGHETYPTYQLKDVQKILLNAVTWAKPVVKVDTISCPNVEPLEKF